MRTDVEISAPRLIVTTRGSLVAPGAISNICPDLSTPRILGFRVKMTVTSPLRQIILTLPAIFEIRKSVPVTAAVIAPACTLPPPAPSGEENNRVPLSNTISRLPGRKRKSALEPTRVIVRSGNSNSARELPPVLRALSPETTSPGAARVFRGNIETRLIDLVTSARSKACARTTEGFAIQSSTPKNQCLIG
jgi:hypothetical protein